MPPSTQGRLKTMGELVEIRSLFRVCVRQIREKIKELGSVEKAIEQLPYSRGQILYVAHKDLGYPLPESCSLLEPVEDVKDIDVIDTFDDDHLHCIEFLFKDEKGRLRYALLYHEWGPGMVRYSQCCKEAKRELIEAINSYYESESE